MSTGRRWADLAQLRAREVGGAFAAVWLGNSAKRRLREALTQRRRRGWLRWLADCARACLGRAPAPPRPRANQRVLQRIPLTGAKEFLPFLREAWVRARAGAAGAQIATSSYEAYAKQLRKHRRTLRCKDPASEPADAISSKTCRKSVASHLHAAGIPEVHICAFPDIEEGRTLQKHDINFIHIRFMVFGAVVIWENRLGYMVPQTLPKSCKSDAPISCRWPEDGFVNTTAGGFRAALESWRPRQMFFVSRSI